MTEYLNPDPLPLFCAVFFSQIPAFVWSKSHLPSSVWGTSYDKMMHSTDWLPTLASLAGTELSGG